VLDNLSFSINEHLLWIHLVRRPTSFLSRPLEKLRTRDLGVFAYIFLNGGAVVLDDGCTRRAEICNLKSAI